MLSYPSDGPNRRLILGALAVLPTLPGLLGDVVLAFETVSREAAAQGKPLVHHVRHLIVHGVLHLLGHDHERDRDARRMETLERHILAGFGVPDPYRVLSARDHG